MSCVQGHLLYIPSSSIEVCTDCCSITVHKELLLVEMISSSLSVQSLNYTVCITMVPPIADHLWDQRKYPHFKRGQGYIVETKCPNYAGCPGCPDYTGCLDLGVSTFRGSSGLRCNCEEI